MIPLPLDQEPFLLEQARHAASVGFVQVGREPGGKVGEWHRTAMLFRDAEASELRHQLHQVRIEAWTLDGVVLTGIDREWRRKACTERPQGWLLTFPGASHAVVYRLRHGGVKRAIEEVRVSTPWQGRIHIEAAHHRSTMARRATLLSDVGESLAQLDRVQLQRWNHRGLILAGVEATGHGRRLEEAWQSWYVTFPRDWIDLPRRSKIASRDTTPA